ncbi:class I SAM-dependent methyltransferase [archaeon]|jgi:ubiquinone/menaquinone biosynthesis C-methylase UbiE|nr:class I SAM-dependent methyltransferase [archaeon]
MNKVTESTIQTYNHTVDEYTRKVADLHHKKEGLYFLSHLQSGDSILDIGCGSARDALIFANRGYDVTGIDLSEKMLDRARGDCPNAQFQNMDMRQLQFPDSHFDGVWAVASLLHIPKAEIPQCLQESYRVLQDGGIVYLSVKQGEGEEFKPDPRYGPKAAKFYSYFQPEELTGWLNNAGFNLLECKIENWNNDYIKHPEIRIFATK